MTAVRPLAAAVLLLALSGPVAAQEEEDAAAWKALAEPGTAALIRHATAPGIGDPPEFRIDDCATQRNLDDRGRAEARALGAEMRRRGLRVARVLTSRWCRARDTAAELGVAPVEDFPPLDSFFSARDREPAATAAVLALLAERAAAEKLVLVTHQVNIRALTGVGAVSGEVVVVEPFAGGLVVRGRIPPP